MHLYKLEEIAKKYGILYTIVVQLDDDTLDIIGDRDKLKYDDIVKLYFDDINSIKHLNKSLEGQLMPRLLSQGEIACIICKPNDNIIISMFFDESKSSFDAVDLSEDVNQDIEELWGGKY
ncbi:hypothetical protein KTC96_08340 [Clostridium estertheticum]|uniref:Uncharacterized protein n=1 Tax=Clostridium estertheticum TaxID=238834 RepID=A0A5N7J0N9_9CLOT|nr:hypothetical protein [Clostridium estertheticum]MBX4262263.1 hypothetical protein [Clostridium estertheticum]MPQ31632.1 hypothetical protein [Clostridium estertheticum]MPQ62305.1 hypothetical protein [Clostridium estertheticum]WLC71989.1 hypothetical protein KTC96_08340 [Clostridium estertheticum]